MVSLKQCAMTALTPVTKQLLQVSRGIWKLWKLVGSLDRCVRVMWELEVVIIQIDDVPDTS